MTTTATTCPYCGVGCGVLASPNADGSVDIAGDPEHPANFGRLCSKGAALGETVSLDGRILHPMSDGKRVTWDAALDRIAGVFTKAITDHGPDSVALYVSGQLLTEDYYVANKLMKGFIGSGNIDTNSRLCMASSVAGHRRAFGADVVPGCYEDLENADLIILVGSNLAWCHPVLFQRIEAARARRGGKPRLVVVDPRRTQTAGVADLHLAIKPGSDAALFNGLLVALERDGCFDRKFVADHTMGLDQALAAARATTPDAEATASLCGLPRQHVRRFFAMVAHTERVVTAYSQGINQSSSGTDKVNAIINCHLATARIGRGGMGPFSLTGQPNAMGGREVGGLANQLAAHMDFGDPAARERLRRFWGTPHVAERPGLKAVDLFQALGDGRIKALWIIGTNPAVSMPDGDAVRQALRVCPFVAVSDCSWASDTVSFADIVLPALTWGEKDGTVTNSERRISRQRSFMPPPGEARADWWAMSEIGRRLGHGPAFGFTNTAEIFREHAALSALDNDGSRAFDLGGLATLSDDDYQGLAPVQWPVQASPGGPVGTNRLFGDGRFDTPDGKASFVAVKPRAPTHALTPGRSLALNTGRVRDHWHTMTRTAKSPTLAQHRAEPFVEMHPDDAAERALTSESLVSVSSDWGTMLGRLIVTTDQNPGSVFVPMHWNDAMAHHARVDALVAPVTDPISGQPESKHTPCAVVAAPMAWAGFALTREPWRLAEAEWCVSVRLTDGWRHNLAGSCYRPDWSQLLSTAFGPGPHWSEMGTSEGDRFHAVRYLDGRLLDCLFIGPAEDPPESRWLEMLFATPPEPETGTIALLAGRPLGAIRDPGPLVCACFGVGRNDLTELIATHQPISVEGIGRLVKAGTNCGSCRSELAGLITAFA